MNNFRFSSVVCFIDLIAALHALSVCANMDDVPPSLQAPDDESITTEVPQLDCRIVKPTDQSLNVYMSQKNITRRVPALVLVFPPLMSAQYFQRYLVQQFPRLFTASSGSSPNGRRFAHEPPAAVYFREAYRQAQIAYLVRPCITRSLSILPILLANCTARAEQLAARTRIVHDRLNPMHAHVFEMMMKVDTEGLRERLDSAVAELTDARTNWDYEEDDSTLTEQDHTNRTHAARVNADRSEFVRMARTIIGQDISATTVVEAAQGPVHYSELSEPSSWRSRAWNDRELCAHPNALPNQIEVLIGSNEVEGGILSQFDCSIDADGESQMLCAFDSARVAESALTTSIIDPEATVYLLVSLPIKFYKQQLEYIAASFYANLPQIGTQHAQEQINQCFNEAMARTTQMMMAHAKMVQDWIVDPAGRRIVVFNTDEVIPRVNFPMQTYQPRPGDKSAMDDALENYYPVFFNACADQFVRAFKGERTPPAIIPLPDVYFNETTRTRVQVARMPETLTTLICAGYATESEIRAYQATTGGAARTEARDLDQNYGYQSSTDKDDSDPVNLHSRLEALVVSGEQNDPDRRYGYDEIESGSDDDRDPPPIGFPVQLSPACSPPNSITSSLAGDSPPTRIANCRSPPIAIPLRDKGLDDDAASSDDKYELAPVIDRDEDE